MEPTILVLKVKGLTEDEIQENFNEFLADMVEKYPSKFGVGLSVMAKGTVAEKVILKLANL